MNFSDIVKNNKSDIAFIVGNGINRFNPTNSDNSWEVLLLKLWNTYSPSSKLEIPTGISLTEFYDVLELRQKRKSSSNNLQKEFCDLMEEWGPSKHHKAFIHWAERNNSPVLTTNFENTLGKAGGYDLNRFSNRKFTDFYPWETYYSDKEISDPENNFAIWHINGMQRYYRSIRLGLTHYMGSVERARKWLHKGNERRLFYGKNQRQWHGSDTWMQVIFNKPIIIFGLSLGQTEVFLRWLFIERAKYFSKFPIRRKDAWYIYTDDKSDSGKVGKLMFLENLGITPVEANNYEELYIEPWSND